jgi:hypothetical protein
MKALLHSLRCRRRCVAGPGPATDSAHRPDRRLLRCPPGPVLAQHGPAGRTDKQPARALVYYKRSARYADKFSQAMVARLYQEGIGTAPIR